MNDAHLHLVLNHLPIVGMLLGIPILVFGLFQNTKEVRRGILGYFVLIVLLTFPVYWTGEPAEHLIENMAGISEEALEQHEHFAEYAFYSMMGFGGFCLIGLLYESVYQSLSKKFLGVTLCLAIICAGLVLWTARLGGHIHHPETRPNFTAPEPENEHESYVPQDTPESTNHTKGAFLSPEHHKIRSRSIDSPDFSFPFTAGETHGYQYR